MTGPARTIAVIGCGRATGTKVGFAIGQAHAAGWRAADPTCRLLAVDPSAENLADFAARFDVPSGDQFASTDELYAVVSPDFVSVCTWPALHAPMVLDAVAHGVRGIVCEKPMAADPAEIRAMLDACATTGVRLAIGHQRRYDPLYRLARRLLADGAIGDDLVLEARVADDWDMLSWTVHWFDMATFLFDRVPTSVLAGASVTAGHRYGHAVEDRSVVFVEYDGGRQAIFISGPDRSGTADVVIRGTHGSIELGADLRLRTDDGLVVHRRPGDAVDGYAALMAELLAVAGTDAAMLCDAGDCATATEVAFAAHESVRTRRTVTLPLVTRFAPLEILVRGPRLALPEGRLVLLADDHFGSGGPEGLAAALAALTGEAPTILDAAMPVASADLADAGTLVLYHTEPHADASTRAALSAWVDAGRPLVLVHGALGAWPGWTTYEGWAGRVWVWGDGGSEHALEPADLHVDPGTPYRPIWSDAWLPRDEVYTGLRDTAAVVDLVSASIPQGIFPAAWTSATHQNVGAWMPGHRGETWTIPAMRDGLAHLLRVCSIAGESWIRAARTERPDPPVVPLHEPGTHPPHF